MPEIWSSYLGSALKLYSVVVLWLYFVPGSWQHYKLNSRFNYIVCGLFCKFSFWCALIEFSLENWKHLIPVLSRGENQE